MLSPELKELLAQIVESPEASAAAAKAAEAEQHLRDFASWPESTSGQEAVAAAALAAALEVRALRLMFTGLVLGALQGIELAKAGHAPAPSVWCGEAECTHCRANPYREAALEAAAESQGGGLL